jgi:hypothetical protein
MIKYYCDRCGKEAKELKTVKIPVRKLKDGSFLPTPLELCTTCENEANEIFDILADIRLSMFAKYCKKGGAE